MIDVILPAPLLRLARVDNPVSLALEGEATQRHLLDALEARFPALRGTTRDRHSGQRRAYVRFFACNRDLSDASPDAPLPEAVVDGREPFLVVGALSGG
ncbi:MoaD/ThiS family protein [Parahaliea mediterranea]|uniref:MoaD/ThiS family protein n=1 Tax=Parahaliea mediterranea TaxID=651086 RepID=A0A939DIZ9_9GAMM|nr:MoaD/ThiS family protein [Parahaliea mediterranea]MBN7798716.1 MoaD/ThiS family protein [Parahaliea mediterranea]